VTDGAAVGDAVEEAARAFGGLDAVVANAGIGQVGFARSMDPASFERIIEVNLVGAWRTVRAALPHVIARRGYVLCVASLAALAHAPGMSAYAASKAGIEAFADALRLEAAPLGVDVGVAYYAWIDTDLVRSADRHELGARMRAQVKWPFARSIPVAVAAEETVRGIERRARWVCCPRWLPAVILARGAFQLIAEREMRAGVADFDAHAERLGPEATAPVGPGGRADSAAVEA
jgi:NAD(P)-dependent dehydrogenase (short-subunit alcohol dehydrogenase family)